MPSRIDDKRFMEFMHSQFEPPSDLLNSAIDWIRTNLNPGDIFEEKELFEWVSDRGEPDSVFSNRRLCDWAESSGYKKDE